jgi:hypothetical protein
MAMDPPPPPPDDDLLLEPVEDARDPQPVVSDIDGRLWRVRTRSAGLGGEILLAALALVIIIAIAFALIM